MSETAKITEALVAFQADMPVVPKAHTAKVPTKAGGSYSYTYAGLADVVGIATPLLTAHGLAFSTCPRQTERGYELVGRLLHTSGEELTGSLPIGGNTPQEIGSALTYARRYLFGCITGLVTDDDDDGRAASRPAQKRAASKPTPPEPDALEAGLRAQAAKPMSEKTRATMFALFGEQGITDADAQRSGISRIVGREVESRASLTESEAQAVISTLRSRAKTGASS